MDDALLAQILDRLDAAALSENAESLALAACQGDDELGAALRDEPPERPDAGEAAPQVEPAGAYLGPVTVAGFRGIGPSATLPLTPGPGLTLVVGRNGSGKSSFAEGIEFLLTGASVRWADRAKAWRDGWRNLHEGGAASVTATVAIEGTAGNTSIRAEWPSGGELTDAAVTVQSPGRPRAQLPSLGWEEPLATFRPFLSYEELGGMLDDGPSRLYDALKAILGLEALNDTEKRLSEARLTRQKAVKDVKKRLETIVPRLSDLDDERAQRARAALAGREWDLAAVETLLLDAEQEEHEADDLSLLRSLSALEAPSPQHAAAVVEELIRSYERTAAFAGTDAADARDTAALLDRALRFHSEHGDGDCPVCGAAAALDASWHTAAEARVAQLNERAREAEAAHMALQSATRTAEKLMTPPPPILAEAVTRDLLDIGTATADWQRWQEGAQLLDEPTSFAAFVQSAVGPLVQSVGKVRAAATVELDRRQQAWLPVARELAGWLPEALDAQAASEAVAPLKEAEDWLKATAAVIRDQRFEPIADRSVQLWNLLRQQSNVDLGRVVLEGTGTRRRVALQVTVDGVPGVALGVMSQGELHALALSLFLPRATLPESPFRFLVIDDPVQSMDPSRVDGLARVLEEVARTRQVIVFTHDDRLPEAVRRLQISARVIEVTRRPGSIVETKLVGDPTQRLLDDARALARTEELPQGVADRVVPGYCRGAIESACIDVIRRRRLARGEPHDEVEQLLETLQSLNKLAATALFDDPKKGGDVLSRLNAITRGGATTYQQCQKGTHRGFQGSLDDLVNDTAELVRAILRQ